MARAPKLEAERPPHDALEGVPLPRTATFLVGHEDAERALLEAYRSGRMHHGWIVTGERGIGKATLAFRLAKFLLANPDPLAAEVLSATDLAVSAEHPAARRVSGGAHPNVLHAEREWNEKQGKYRSAISVETVRRINHFLANTAGEEGWRIVIIDPADDMTPSAANALLKNLEEPPRRSVFLLLARSRGALIPTILSRCRVLDLKPLTPAQVASVLSKVAPDRAAQANGLAGQLAGGSVRRLWELADHDGAAIYRDMLRAVRGDTAAQMALAGLAGEPEPMRQFLELYQDFLARRVRRAPEPDADAQAPDAPLVTWAGLWEKAQTSGREVETYNLDRKQFVLDLLESTAAAVRQAGTANE